ncbi:hypothetical protein F5Y19DRAFT_449208 [Xylariaceae sp. FL1651]|nr:hypothetical protein F5Y19DRAFT_449208 [Xylariaceae sp. FL1651]
MESMIIFNILTAILTSAYPAGRNMNVCYPRAQWLRPLVFVRGMPLALVFATSVSLCVSHETPSISILPGDG